MAAMVNYLIMVRLAFDIIACMSYHPGSLKNDFLLDPSVVFLNHGSFGATPRPVFEAYQSWQSELERQPVEFIGRKAPGILREARAKLADYVGAGHDDLVYVPNATHAANAVIRSIQLADGDEVLSSDQEYGAIERVWSYVSKKVNIHYKKAHVPVPYDSKEDWLDQFWSQVTPRTRVISLSHVTSPTALIFPIREICQRARAAGIITVIDGAHAPGQVELNLKEMGVDFYYGNLHKWLCAPKGAAFLYARPEVQNMLDPLVVGWGYESNQPGPSRFIDHYEWTGTRDVSAYLAVPAAIQYFQDHNWDGVRAACHAMAINILERIAALCDQPLLSTPAWYSQMACAPLHPGIDLPELSKLFQAHHIEVPLPNWNGRKLMRISVQAYTASEDLDCLYSTLKDFIRVHPLETTV